MLHLNKPEKVIKKVQVYMKEGIQNPKGCLSTEMQEYKGQNVYFRFN